MPPFVPHKRRRSPVSPTAPHTKKTSLFETADLPSSSKTLQDHRNLLDSLNDSGEESSLSDVSSDQFEDALPPPNAKRQKVNTGDDDREADDGEDIDWEDAMDHDSSVLSAKPSAAVSGDLDITLARSDRVGYLSLPHDKKKGPTKIERQIRLSTHCMHVQFLLFHNSVRSGWATDKEAQKILVNQLPPNVKNEVERWRTRSGFVSPQQEKTPSQKKPRQGQRGRTRKSHNGERKQRDWGISANKEEMGVPDMSHGDPLIRLLKVLAAYWRKRFTIVAPGLRKQGYKALAALEEEISSFKKGPHSIEEHGERIDGIHGFRTAAETCEGSRDLCIQLFTALIRGLGIEARLVASLQPVGFGWRKHEEATMPKGRKSEKPDTDNRRLQKDPAGDENSYEAVERETSTKRASTTKSGAMGKRAARGGESRHIPIYLSDNSDDIAPISIKSDDDNESLIDVTPSIPRKRANKNYDRDLPAPTYWVEAVSPITNHVLPVDPFRVPSAVLTNPDDLLHFEPRGANAEKAKQVLAYVVAYSSDGTAKDVTTRYLKRHVWPGRTKGYRVPVEKIPIHNSKGKIKYYTQHDWFETVMRGYRRTETLRDIVDEIEDETDLKPTRAERKETDASKDTLQGYKTSAEFVLERHLRREEALRPSSQPVKYFTVGKGDSSKEEPVFKRSDVEVCRTGESWHKEGRTVKAGEHPMKMVPVRAVTLNRKREVEEAERDSGEKLKQGLYARHQTEWIIPPPISNGVIPKNAYGNIDCFVPTMVPKGASHVPFRGTVKVCKRLGIDFAEAVTGFEFGNKMAVPVITGVVIAKENEATVKQEWEKDEEERRIKEEGKREKLALATWRKWLMGLRVIQRVHEEYGGMSNAQAKEQMNPFTNKKRSSHRQDNTVDLTKGRKSPSESADNYPPGSSMAEYDDDVAGGGFLLEDEEAEPAPAASDLHVEDGNSSPSAQPLGIASLAGISNGNSDTPVDNMTGMKRPVQSNGILEANVTGVETKTTGRRARKTHQVKKEKEDKSISHTVTKPKETVIGNSRSTPKRVAARDSQRATTSHYFENSGSDEEDGVYKGTTAVDDESVRDISVNHRAGRTRSAKKKGPGRQTRSGM